MPRETHTEDDHEESDLNAAVDGVFDRMVERLKIVQPHIADDPPSLMLSAVGTLVYRTMGHAGLSMNALGIEAVDAHRNLIETIAEIVGDMCGSIGPAPVTAYLLKIAAESTAKGAAEAMIKHGRD